MNTDPMNHPSPEHSVDHQDHLDANESTLRHQSDPLPSVAAEPTPARGVRIVHLVLGIFFLGVAAIWALNTTNDIEVDISIGFALPMILILAGVAGLAAMLVNGARGRRTTTHTD